MSPTASTATIVLRAEDEFPHAPDGRSDLPWLDTWWFVARDPDAGVAVHVHIARVAAPELGLRAAVTVLDGGRRATAVLRSAPAAGDVGIANDLVGLTVLDPSWDERKRLRLDVRTPELTAELSLSGRFPAADVNELCPGVMPATTGGPPGPSAHGQLRHVEQAMSFTGRLAWSGEVARSIGGAAIRDRSWGWRQTESMFRFGWDGFFANGPDHAVGLTAFHSGYEPDAGGSRVSSWYADSGGVRGCEGGELWLDGSARVAQVLLRRGGGKEVRARVTDQVCTAYLPSQDPVVGQRSLLLTMAEHHMDLQDAGGAALRGFYTTGRPILSDVLHGARFCLPEASG